MICSKPICFSFLEKSIKKETLNKVLMSDSDAYCIIRGIEQKIPFMWWL